MLSLSVEKALEWAYRDELPKAGAAARLRGPKMATPGWVRAAETWAARIDVSNAYGLMPDCGATAPPHPAAIALNELIGSLDDVAFAGDCLDVFAEWRGGGAGEEVALLGMVEAAARERALQAVDGECLRPRGDLAALLRRCALLGPPVGWDGPRPVARIVASTNGARRWFRKILQPARFNEQGRPVAFVEIEQDDGWDAVAKRPRKGAYTKTCLGPDAVRLAEARLEWRIWRLTLDVVVEMAREAFFTFDGRERVTIEEMGLAIQPSQMANQPWVTGNRGVIRGGMAAAVVRQTQENSLVIKTIGL